MVRRACPARFGMQIEHVTKPRQHDGPSIAAIAKGQMLAIAALRAKAQQRRPLRGMLTALRGLPQILLPNSTFVPPYCSCS